MSANSEDRYEESGRADGSLSLLHEPANRVTLHLLCRLPNRLFMMANPIGPLRHRRGQKVGVALVAIDLAQAWLLRRRLLDGRYGRRARMALDALDAAAVVGLSPFDVACGCGALLDSAPLTAEIAYQDGVLRALVAAVPSAATVGLVRAVKGRSPGLGDIALWTALQIAFGRLASMAEHGQLRRRSEREAIRRQAAGEQAFLSGRRAWVRAHLKLLDRLQRFGLRIVDVPGVQLATREELDKAAKTVRIVDPPTPGRPAFLDALLLQYQLERKLTHLIADRIAITELPPADRQLLLTPGQSRRLWDALTIHGVAGQLTIEITERISRGLDTELTLHITSSRSLNEGPPTDTILKLPTGSPAWRVEFVTLGLVYAGAHCVQLAGAGRTSRAVNLTSMAMSGTIATLAEWRVRQLGSDAAPAAALTAFGPALFAAIIGTSRMQAPRNSDGVAIYPGIWALTGISYVLGFYAERMTPKLQRLLIAGIAAQLTSSWLSSSRPRSISAYNAELIWATAGMIGGNRFAGALNQLSLRVTDENEQRTTDHVQDQWLAGWSHQQHEAELLHDLAQLTISQARPQIQDHHDKIANAHREHRRLADDLRQAAMPLFDDRT